MSFKHQRSLRKILKPVASLTVLRPSFVNFGSNFVICLMRQSLKSQVKKFEEGLLFGPVNCFLHA
jgi:hypothetical protein